MKLKKIFLSGVMGGLVVILPMIILAVMVTWVLGSLNIFLSPLSDQVVAWASIHSVFAYLAVLAGFILVLFLLGLAVRTGFGRVVWIYTEENLLYRIPLYKFMRTTVNQFTSSEDSPFRESAFARLHDGVSVLGFVTDKFSNGDYMVFIPTAPNPTNGNMYRLGKDRVTILDVSIEKTMQSIVGCGRGSANLQPSKT